MRIKKMILFEDSRKVGFGVWLFLIATVLLIFKCVNSADWFMCAMASSGLIGGGTIADKFLESKRGKN